MSGRAGGGGGGGGGCAFLVNTRSFLRQVGAGGTSEEGGAAGEGGLGGVRVGVRPFRSISSAAANEMRGAAFAPSQPITCSTIPHITCVGHDLAALATTLCTASPTWRGRWATCHDHRKLAGHDTAGICGSLFTAGPAADTPAARHDRGGRRGSDEVSRAGRKADRGVDRACDIDTRCADPDSSAARRHIHNTSRRPLASLPSRAGMN